jgi:hypothetical protein
VKLTAQPEVSPLVLLKKAFFNSLMGWNVSREKPSVFGWAEILGSSLSMS